MVRRILIVEDYEDARLCMKLILEIFGYEVIEAANGLEAVEATRQQFPHIILMDISMPVMDGLTATKTIRTFQQMTAVPIIAVTAHGTQLYQEAIAAGCDDLIGKPVDFDSLELLLDQYLKA